MMKAPPAHTKTALKAIKLNCLQCCGDEIAVRNFCTCDGVHGTYCFLWPYRFGCKPQSIAKRYSKWLVTPSNFFPANSREADRLPKSLSRAAEFVERLAGREV